MSKTSPVIEPEPWYAVRCLFYHNDKKAYEERTIIIKAANVEEAISKAEADAVEYCTGPGKIQYLHYLDTFHLFSEKLKDGVEIFSLIRTIDLDTDAYIDRFLDSGTEHRT